LTVISPERTWEVIANGKTDTTADAGSEAGKKLIKDYNLEEFIEK
jgi:hypothetical protein